MHLIWPLASRFLSQPTICRRVIESDGVTSHHRRLCRLTPHMSLSVKVRSHWEIANTKVMSRTDILAFSVFATSLTQNWRQTTKKNLVLGFGQLLSINQTLRVLSPDFSHDMYLTDVNVQTKRKKKWTRKRFRYKRKDKKKFFISLNWYRCRVHFSCERSLGTPSHWSFNYTLKSDFKRG